MKTVSGLAGNLLGTHLQVNDIVVWYSLIGLRVLIKKGLLGGVGVDRLLTPKSRVRFPELADFFSFR